MGFRDKPEDQPKTSSVADHAEVALVESITWLQNTLQRRMNSGWPFDANAIAAYGMSVSRIAEEIRLLREQKLGS